MDIGFDDLRRFAEACWPNPIETSLLGYVGHQLDPKSGQLTGVIPEWIEKEARKHGLEVLTADYRRGTYSFRLLPPSKELRCLVHQASSKYSTG